MSKLDVPAPTPGGLFVISIGMVAALGPLAIDMYLPSILDMASDLETSYARMQLSLTVFLLAMGIGQLLFGPIADAVGRRRPLLVGLTLYILMAGLAGFSGTFEMLILARTLQGLAAAMLLVVAMSSVRDVAEGVRAAQIFAMLMTIEGLAPILAPVAGGIVGASFGWRGVLLVLGVLGMGVLLNSVFNFSETLPRHSRAPLSLRSVLRTYREILSDIDFVLPGLALTSAFFFLFAYVGGAGYAYQSGYGLSVETFGFVFGGTGVAVLLGAMLAGRLVARTRIQTLAVMGVCLMFLGSFLALLASAAGFGLAGVVAGMAVAMLGLGIAEATLMSIAMAARETAVGASVAVLGAFQLGVAGLATPFAGQLVEKGAGTWLTFLAVTSMGSVVLTVACAYRSVRSGRAVAMQH